MMSVDKRTKFVELAERINPFKEYDYHYIKSEEKKSDLVGNSISCFLFNKKLNQAIEIKFTDGVQGFLTIYIKRGDAKFAKDILNVESYLKFKKNTYPEIFDLKIIEGQFEEKISIFLKNLEDDIIPLIRNVLITNNWDAIPIDWHNYK